MHVQEQYNPYPVGVNATIDIAGNSIGGFLCKTSGTITVTAAAPNGASFVTIVDAVPVTAGIYYPLPFRIQGGRGTFTTAGGASGTLGV